LRGVLLLGILLSNSSGVKTSSIGIYCLYLEGGLGFVFEELIIGIIGTFRF
jgi:hypothetical protein